VFAALSLKNKILIGTSKKAEYTRELAVKLNLLFFRFIAEYWQGFRLQADYGFDGIPEFWTCSPEQEHVEISIHSIHDFLLKRKGSPFTCNF